MQGQCSARFVVLSFVIFTPMMNFYLKLDPIKKSKLALPSWFSVRFCRKLVAGLTGA